MKLTQQNKVLKLLRENQSVNSHDLTYLFGIKQAPTRVNELKEKGYSIISKPNYTRKSPSVDYVLNGEKQDKPKGHYEYDGGIARWIEEKPVVYRQGSFI